MSLRREHFRTFHRTLYGSLLESVRVLKRGDDFQENIVRAVILFECRWSIIQKHGQPIQGDMSTEHYRDLHVPQIQMDANGIAYFNVLDRFVDKEGRYWEPESGQTITSKLLENHCCITCRRLDAVSPWLGVSYS